MNEQTQVKLKPPHRLFYPGPRRSPRGPHRRSEQADSDASRAGRIAALNDAMRHDGPGQELLTHDTWRVSQGIKWQSLMFATLAGNAVKAFDTFTPDNDPYGRRDLGSFEIEGKRLVWKIDYYDLALEFASADPADPSVTRRVLTIMFATEY